MKRSFSSRAELEAYLRETFSFLADDPDGLSPIPGGQSAARAALAAIDPPLYAGSRNHLDGAVSRLSMYIRHGVLTLPEVLRAALARVSHPAQARKFVQELAWRDYWQRLYHRLGNRVWEDQEPSKTGLPPHAYAPTLPPELPAARTGLACIDSFVRELRSTGYLHNHARLWFAAFVVHWLRVRWQAGARFFLTHLLDGDPASNNLSWQWVASTFSHKPYFFNRENLEQFTSSRYCATCPRAQSCPFDAPYPELAAQLFPRETTR